jgi:hypothetical protein
MLAPDCCIKLLPAHVLQVDALQQALAQMQEQVAATEERAEAAASAAEAQATEQLQLGLRQQALKYERQIQVRGGGCMVVPAVQRREGGLYAIAQTKR